MSRTKPRPAMPKPLRLTERDRAILEAVYQFEGLMSRRQIAQLFFNGIDGSPIRNRLRVLFENGYLLQPETEHRYRVPEMIYWLDKRGLEVVAGLHGEDPLYRDMRRRDEPKWAKVEHEIAINDFRLAVIDACKLHPALQLEEWRGAWQLATYDDEVIYLDKNGRKTKRQMKPDGYFVVNSSQGRSRLLLEIDRATEDNPRFVREKVLPGIAYLKSDIYEQRFGYKSGRWLIVTTGEKRLQNMKRQSELAAGAAASLFYFTTFARISPETVLTTPIWYRGGAEEPTALFERTVYQTA